jgi:HEAT repeat protein
MAPRFDGYSRRTKAAFISAMIACSHREFLIYVMKALTSRDQELVKMALYAIYANIGRLKDPDKLLRSLIALSTESESENELIIDIFTKFFSQKNETRQYNILKDKIYNYIIVTLESYFEMFRKEFMIREVIEKSYPEAFQHVRKFILEKFTPEIKKNIVSYLLNEDPSSIKGVFIDIAKWVTYIDESEKDGLSQLLQLLYDSDKKSRENTAARIDDLQFEKRYLRDRIIRLCKIIEGLSINEAASTLVNIYNYLKKYPDQELLSASIHCLSMLNYSYMLGEVEVMLTAGSPQDRATALDLLALFHEQRSMNIIIDYLQSRTAETSPEIRTLIAILLERDISGNVTINGLLKKIVENNPDAELRGMAILGVGNGGFEGDIEYLSGLFAGFSKNEPKDTIVRAMGSILSINTDINKRSMIKHLQEYLKDPGIKMRIYACLLLVKLGDRDAIRSIRDMLIIKNKVIQRDILTIMGELQSVEFAFFLISLLKDEYALCGDIIPILEKLPEEDLRELDSFVVNIFRKFETPDIEILGQHREKESGDPLLPIEEKTILAVDLFKIKADTDYSLTERINLNMRLKSLISAIIDAMKGTISQVSTRRTVAYFSDADQAVSAALKIAENFTRYNLTRVSDLQINVQCYVATVKAKIVNEEVVQLPHDSIIEADWLPFSCDVFCNSAAFAAIHERHTLVAIPEGICRDRGLFSPIYAVIRPINFTAVAEKILGTIIRDEEEKARLQMQVEADMKKIKRESRPQSSVAIARDMEDIGEILRVQLDEIERYVQRRSTDREMIKNIRKMLKNIHDRYRVEISRLIIE